MLVVQVDQMVIHSASDPRPRTTLCGDYFYNYFTRGLDILFDGQVLSSFLIGSLIPCFGVYESFMLKSSICC